MNICVFCSSSDAVDTAYFSAATKLGALMGSASHRLIYGGGAVGLMGTVARAVHAQGGQVTGIIPEALHNIEGVAYDATDELIVTQCMRERKTLMDSKSEAFIALPGGIGTLDEILEILTIKQLGYHQRPVVFLNTNNFYKPLIDIFEHFYTHSFAKPSMAQLYHVANTPEDALHWIENYQTPELEPKWFK